MSSGENIPEHQHLAGKRGVLFEAIRDEPGIHFSSLRRQTGIPSGTASYHLTVLQALGYVDSVYSGPVKRFFPQGMPREAFGEAAVYARDPAVSELLEIIGEQPGIRQQRVAEEYGQATRQTVASRLEKCTRLGLLRKDHRPGTETRYWLNGHMQGTDEDGA